MFKIIEILTRWPTGSRTSFTMIEIDRIMVVILFECLILYSAKLQYTLDTNLTEAKNPKEYFKTCQ